MAEDNNDNGRGEQAGGEGASGASGSTGPGGGQPPGPGARERDEGAARGQGGESGGGESENEKPPESDPVEVGRDEGKGNDEPAEARKGGRGDDRERGPTRGQRRPRPSPGGGGGSSKGSPGNGEEDTAAPDYRFECRQLDGVDFKVARFRGWEGISQLYRFEIDLVVEGEGHANVDIDVLQHADSTFTIKVGRQVRRIHGLVRRAEIITHLDDRTVYHVELVPHVWQLGQRLRHKVYVEDGSRDLGIRDLVRRVLAEADIEPADEQLQLEDTYRGWPFRLQYGQSYWDFLSWCMERDGVYYYFTAADDQEQIVFCDDRVKQPPIEGLEKDREEEFPALEYTTRPGTAPKGSGANIHGFIPVRERVVECVHVHNYNDAVPSQRLTATASIGADGVEVEVAPLGDRAPGCFDAGDGINIYGQNIADEDEARHLARVRAEEILASRLQYHGESTCCRLAPAGIFSLAGHPRDECNGDFQVVEIEHQGHVPGVAGSVGLVAQGDATGRPPGRGKGRGPADIAIERSDGAAGGQGRHQRKSGQGSESGSGAGEDAGDRGGGDAPVYENRFRAIPESVQYRPPRRTDRPPIHGCLTAIIDSDSDGEESYAQPDQQGRYHIYFPFDRQHESGRASHAVRVMEPYGGEREGIHFPLRKGSRVLIGFYGGDPDQPVIQGACPTTEQPPVTTEENHTEVVLKTPCGNEFKIDDHDGEIKLSTPTCKSYLDLGASSVNANGITLATEGLALWASLGGVSFQFATDGWVVDSDIWPIATKDARDAEIGGYALGHVTEHEFSAEWRQQDGIDKFFRFPKKHRKPASGDPGYRPRHDELSDADDHTDADGIDYITIDDEASSLFHTSRNLGDTYSFRSGTDFSFQGTQREAFDFGAMASFTSYRHDQDAQALRDGLKKALEPFEGTDESALGQEQDEYAAARRAYEAELHKRIRRETLLVLHEAFGDKFKADNFVEDRCDADDDNDKWSWIDVTATDDQRDVTEEDRSTRTAVKRIADNLGAEIVHVDDIANAIERINQDAHDDDQLSPFKAFETWFEEADADGASLTYADEDPQDTDTYIGKADYDVKKTTVDDKWEALKDAWSDSARRALLEGRLSLTDADSLSVSRGAGHSFTIGPSYSETYIEPVDRDGAAETFDPGANNGDAFNNLIHCHLDTDLADEGGPAWGEISVPVGGSGAWDHGKVAVGKTFGNQYSLHVGHSASVHAGESYSVEQTDRQVTELRDIDGMVIHKKDWTPALTQEYSYHPLGATMVPGYASVKSDIEGGAELADSISRLSGQGGIDQPSVPRAADMVQYKMDRWDATGNQVLTVNISRSAENTINLALKQTGTVNLGAFADISINVGTKSDISLNVLNKNTIDVTVALQLDASFSPGGLLKVENMSYDFNVASVGMKQEMNKLDTKVTEIGKATAAINRRTISMSSNTVKTANTSVHLDNAGIKLF